MANSISGATGRVHVEIVAKYRGCPLCDLALAILEETAEELSPGDLSWQVVDVSTREEIERMEQLARACGQRPAIPSIFINQQYAFDHIPDMDRMSAAVGTALG